MPWDETERYIRSGHENPDKYETCRTITISEEEGIRAIYCKLRGQDRWEIQSFLFEKEKGWTMEKAKEWFRTHSAAHKALPDTLLDHGLPLRFFAQVRDWHAKEGKRLVRIYLMDTSLNRNNWRVTDEALEKALDSLIGKPLTARPGYRINHVSNPITVGEFVDAEKPNGYAIATAEITDPIAWEKIKSGEWKPVSVEITARKVICSKCGQDILDEPDEHVKSGEAHEVILDFTFNRVAFVSEPAYPRAGILVIESHAGLEQTRPQKRPGLTAEKDGGDLSKTVLKTAGVIPFEETPKAPEDMEWNFRAADYTIEQLRRACAWYDSKKPDVKASYKLPHHLPDGRVVWRGVAAAMAVLMGARGGVDIPESDRRGVYNHLARHYRQFGREPPEFQAAVDSHESDEKNEKGGENTDMSERIAELQERLEAVTAEKEKLESRVAELESELEKIREERHMEKVAELVDLRVEAGLVKDRKAEIERLRNFDDETLELLRSDAEAFIAEKQRISKIAGPRARFTAKHEDLLKQKIEETRMRLFGHQKKEGEG